jgi:hypothetical protein
MGGWGRPRTSTPVGKGSLPPPLPIADRGQPTASRPRGRRRPSVRTRRRMLSAWGAHGSKRACLRGPPRLRSFVPPRSTVNNVVRLRRAKGWMGLVWCGRGEAPDGGVVEVRWDGPAPSLWRRPEGCSGPTPNLPPPVGGVASPLLSRRGIPGSLRRGRAGSQTGEGTRHRTLSSPRAYVRGPLHSRRPDRFRRAKGQ